MSAAVVTRTDEPCPVCGIGLFVVDDGHAIAAECRLCGYFDGTWTDETEGGDGR
jgi:ribosomal protein S27AE